MDEKNEKLNVCPKCGVTLEPGAKFCYNCGATIECDSNSENISYEDAQANKLIAIFCYFGIFMLIPFLIRPNSQFIRFHCNQGLILIIFNFICGLIMMIPIIGWIIGTIGVIFGFICFIIGIINAATGKVKDLPLIGKYRIIR